MLEGRNERALLDILISLGKFSINNTDMIDDQPIVLRQIKGKALVYINGLRKDEKITVIRIGDTIRDDLKKPKEIKHRIETEIKICTKPELEILIIIAKGMYEHFKNQKLFSSAKSYCKANITNNGKKYNGSSAWISDFFTEDILIDVLRKYKTYMNANHKPDELFLIDFIAE